MVVTNGDVSDIAQDRKFMQGLLEEIGICETPTKWSVTPCRSKYYSEYLDEEDWRDIWQLVWKLQMTIDQPVCPEIKANSLIPWTPTDVTGDEWLKVVDEDKTTCFVVSDFNNDADLRKAKAAILSNPQVEKLREKYRLDIPAFSYTKVLGKYKQLQVSLGQFEKNFYALGADYAEIVLSLCQDLGGTINFDERRA